MQGGHPVEGVKELIHEGSVRRIIIIKDAGGKTAMEAPVTVGVVGFFVAPAMAAIGALAALAGGYPIEVEPDTPESAEPGDTRPGARGVPRATEPDRRRTAREEEKDSGSLQGPVGAIRRAVQRG